MIDTVNAGKRAKEIFESGVCCSEAVVHTIAETIDPENAIMYTKMSSGLCGGMGSELNCGVLTGGACAIGIYLGRDSIDKAPEVKCSGITKQFASAFIEHFGSAECSVLKAKAPNPEQHRLYCKAIVEWGAIKAAEIINQNI